MKFTAFILSVLVPALIFANDKIETQVTSATVFPRGALLKHTVKTSISPSTDKLILTGLTAHLDPSSIRVEGKGDFTVLNVSFRTAKNTSEKPPKMIKYRDSLDHFQAKLRAVEGTLEALKEEREMLAANKAVKGSDRNLTAQELENMANFYRSRIAEIIRKRGEAEVQKGELNADITRIKDSLRVWENERNRPVGELVVEIETGKSQRAELEVTYFTDRANWRPIYDMRARPDRSEIEAVMYADISQNTGREWRNIELSVSTATPASFSRLPDLPPWQLRFIQPQKINMRGARTNAPAAAEMSYDAADGESASKSRADYVQLTENVLSLDIDLKKPFSVKGDGTSQNAALRELNIAADFEYYAVPKHNRNAFLMARIPEPEKYNLIPGQMKVFLDGIFVGRSQLNPDIEDTLDLSLGADKRIVIERVQTRDYSADRRLSDRVKREFGYEITVRNLKSVPVELTVQDQIPLSTDKDIEVKPDVKDGTTLNDKTGMITKKMKVNPGESSSFRFGFEVIHPKDKKVGGL